jgi:hypothetical protein
LQPDANKGVHSSWQLALFLVAFRTWHAVFAACCPDYDEQRGGGYLGKESTLSKLGLAALEIWEDGPQAFVPVELGDGGRRFKANTREMARRVTGPGEGVFSVESFPG